MNIFVEHIDTPYPVLEVRKLKCYKTWLERGKFDGMDTLFEYGTYVLTLVPYSIYGSTVPFPFNSFDPRGVLGSSYV